MPRFALLVVGSTPGGFGAASLVRRRIAPLRLVASASPQFCLFVLAVGALDTVWPTEPTLLGMAALAGVVDNLPAALLLG
ncbi:hypothetical protein [Pseudonocardia humida]|uniref:hypothetical protein n=1 Tax=Pseudonocardia humida TaxID=2800819 RepID=UPI00207C960A|nr:hypothetical protein [Pseudonocardia humida]